MTRGLITIACDESGAEGENIVNSQHPLFVHGSTSITIDEAQELLAIFRAVTRAQAPEIKSRTALARNNRTALLNLLRHVGPRGNIYLLEKQFFMSAKLVHTLIVEPLAQFGTDAARDGLGRKMASILHENGAWSVGQDRWQRLLGTFNDLIRLHAREGTSPPSPELFFRALRDAKEACRQVSVAEILELMWDFHEYVSNYGSLDSRARFREFDPMFGTLSSVAMTWRIRAGDGPIEFVVDQYGSLDEETIEKVIFAATDPLELNPEQLPRGRLQSIRLVDSKTDARVQIADILAGCGQVISQMAADHVFDDDLQNSTREMLDCNGMWADSSPLDALWERDVPKYYQSWVTSGSSDLA